LTNPCIGCKKSWAAAGSCGCWDFCEDKRKLENTSLPRISQLKLIGLEALICDLAMYREDIRDAPGRFQRVVDCLIERLEGRE
jgi:hypothetical protein